MQLDLNLSRFFERFGCPPAQQAKMQRSIEAKASNVQHAEVVLSRARMLKAEIELAEQADEHLNRLHSQLEAFQPLEARLDGVITSIESSVDRVTANNNMTAKLFKNVFLALVICFATTIVMGQNTDLLAAQKACYEQATLVESNSTAGQIVDKEMYGTQWTNHYDAHNKTCWVLEVWFDTASRDVFKTGLSLRVFDAFVAHAYPDGEFLGKNDGNKIDISRDICVVHNVRCSNSGDFGTLIHDWYGFPDGVTIGMIGESVMAAENTERKFKAAQAAKAKAR